MNHKVNFRFVVFAFVLAIVAAGLHSQLCHAQATAGSVSGRIADPTGAAIPGANVVARNEAMGFAAASRTSGTGDYTLANLPPGTYRLTATKDGFATMEVSGLDISIDQKILADFAMQLGAASETITVNADAIQLRTRSAETGEAIESRQILDLPLVGRKFLDLALLMPGVSAGGRGNNVNLSVSGQMEFSNSILVDGVETTTNRNNDTNVRPSVDSVEEFKVLTSAYAPEFGWSSGGIVAIQTKPGSNKRHGSVYEFFRPSATAARAYFSRNPPSLKQHNFGGTIGGPIKKDRTHFFASYEGARIGDVFSFLDSVPPASQIRFLANGDADLSGLRDPSTGKPVPIFDPEYYASNFVARQFPGNIVPASRISPAGKAVLQNFFPAPNTAGILNGWFNNYIARQTYAYLSHTVDARLDRSLGESGRIAATYHRVNFDSTTGDRFAGSIPVKGGGDADQGDRQSLATQSVSIVETHILRRAWVNEFRAALTGFRLDQISLLDGRDVAAEFGIANVNLPAFPQTSGFPYIFLGTGYQTGGSTFKPLHFDDRNLQFSESLGGRMGSHEVKAGIDLRRLRSKPRFSLFPTGFQYYGGAYASLTGDPNYAYFDGSAFFGNGGSDIADILLGIPYSVTEGMLFTSPTTVSWATAFYAQDAWRAANRLVVLYGLRYEYQSPFRETNRLESNFDPSTNSILLAGHGRALIEPDRNNFAPRIALAMQLTPKLVVRTGYGVNFSPENDARSDVLTQNFPFGIQQVFTNDIFQGLPFAYRLDTGVPRPSASPVAPNADSIAAAKVLAIAGTKQNVVFVDPRFRTGYSQIYNFTAESELGNGTKAEAGYVGAVARKLPYAVGNINAAGRLTNSLGRIRGQFSQGSSSFHSLQIKVRREWADRVSLLAAYTYGKNIDNGPAPFNLGHNLNSNNYPQNAFDLSQERAAADIDVAHNVSIAYMYRIPFAEKWKFDGFAGRAAAALFSKWQIGAIFAARTGTPVNVVRNANNADFEGLRPNLAGKANLDRNDRTLKRYFNTKAFDSSAFRTSPLASGNAGRNLIRGPGFVNVDMSLAKEIALGETPKLQLRFEFMNLANTPHFSNPVGDMSSGNFGSVTGTIANPRIVQFATKISF